MERYNKYTEAELVGMLKTFKTQYPIGTTLKLKGGKKSIVKIESVDKWNISNTVYQSINYGRSNIWRNGELRYGKIN